MGITVPRVPWHREGSKMEETDVYQCPNTDDDGSVARKPTPGERTELVRGSKVVEVSAPPSVERR
jgi:hypothetical protein